MFNKKKSLQHLEPKEYQLLLAVSMAIDRLEKNEADANSLGVATTVILSKLEYSEVEATTAGIQVQMLLHDEFSETYWKHNEFAYKLGALMAVVATAEKIISEGKLDEKIKSQAKKQLANRA